MDSITEQFLDYLKQEKRMSKNTVQAYKQDMAAFLLFLNGRGTHEFAACVNADVVAYLLELKKQGKAGATLNRKIASLRALYNYLLSKGLIAQDPTAHIKSPKIERKDPEFLTMEEVETLLELPDKTMKGMRDKAILEILYATGIRVSELIEANLSDINMRMGFMTCTGEHGKARVIPMGRPARSAVEDYIYEIRPKFLRENLDEEALFLNYQGQRLSRQGLWKILKEYASKIGIENKITPQTLRNSFAVHMVQNGADLKSLQELMGHEDMTATQIYLSVTKNRIKDVYDKTHPRA